MKKQIIFWVNNMETVMSIIALILSIVSIVITYIIARNDNKNEWYWNIVINPINTQIDFLIKISDNPKNEQEKMTEINRIFRIIKKTVSFLEINYSAKKIVELKTYIENEQNNITVKMFSSDENYVECINNFEIELYKKIFCLILNKKIAQSFSKLSIIETIKIRVY